MFPLAGTRGEWIHDSSFPTLLSFFPLPIAALAEERSCVFTAAGTYRNCTCFANRVDLIALLCRFRFTSLHSVAMQISLHIFAAVLPRKGNHRKKGGGLPGNRDNKNCGNSRRNCRSRISASKTTAVRTCRPRCGSHRLSSSPDLRFPGFAWPSQGNPNDRLSPHAEPPRIQWRYRS